MRALFRPGLVLLGTAVVLLGGGGILAYAAGWTSSTDSVTFTVHAAAIPRIPRPVVTLVGPPVVRPKRRVAGQVTTPPVLAQAPRIRWRTVTISTTVAVHRYVVTRHIGPLTRIVCTLPATKTPSCLDTTAPPGDPLSYTVTATHGAYWVGPDSEPSLPLTTDGTPVAMTVTGAPMPPSPSAGAPSAAAGVPVPSTGVSEPSMGSLNVPESSLPDTPSPAGATPDSPAPLDSSPVKVPASAVPITPPAGSVTPGS